LPDILVKGADWELDDIVGSVLKYVGDNGLDDNTIIVFSTDNGAENFTWPDGGQTPFAGGKGTALEGGFRVPALIRWPGKVPAGKVENSIMSGLDWFPTLVARRPGNPNITDDCSRANNWGPQVQGASGRLQPDGPPLRSKARRSEE
jgi:arylsulfatase